MNAYQIVIVVGPASARYITKTPVDVSATGVYPVVFENGAGRIIQVAEVGSPLNLSGLCNLEQDNALRDISMDAEGCKKVASEALENVLLGRVTERTPLAQNTSTTLVLDLRSIEEVFDYRESGGGVALERLGRFSDVDAEYLSKLSTKVFMRKDEFELRSFPLLLRSIPRRDMLGPCLCTGLLNVFGCYAYSESRVALLRAIFEACFTCDARVYSHVTGDGSYEKVAYLRAMRDVACVSEFDSNEVVAFVRCSAQEGANAEASVLIINRPMADRSPVVSPGSVESVSPKEGVATRKSADAQGNVPPGSAGAAGSPGVIKQDISRSSGSKSARANKRMRLIAPVHHR